MWLAHSFTWAMQIPDIEVLTTFAAKFLEGIRLTPAERAEVLRIAQGFHYKGSAASTGVSNVSVCRM